MKTVLVEVKGGIAQVIRAPKNLAVEIVDLDLLREGDIEDIRDYWNGALSTSCQRHVRLRYPKLFDFLTTELGC